MPLEYCDKLLLKGAKGRRKAIRRGSKVAIRPVAMRKVTGTCDYREEEVRRLEEWLGSDPLTVEQLAYWPCGRGMLYFADGKRPGAGCLACEFIAL